MMLCGVGRRLIRDDMLRKNEDVQQQSIAANAKAAKTTRKPFASIKCVVQTHFGLVWAIVLKNCILTAWRCMA